MHATAQLSVALVACDKRVGRVGRVGRAVALGAAMALAAVRTRRRSVDDRGVSPGGSRRTAARFDRRGTWSARSTGMKPQDPTKHDDNQGEGDRRSARDYNEQLREFMDHGKVAAAAHEAKAYV